MGEENQNVVMQTAQPTLKEKADKFLAFQRQAREQQRQEASLRSAKNMENVFMAGINSTDPKISQRCNRSVRVQQVAQGIRDFFARPENGGIDYSNIKDVPLFDEYVNMNPNRKAQLYDYVLDDNQICDPRQLYYDMGWETPEEQIKVNEAPEGESNTWTNILGGLTESVLGIPKFAGKVGADLAEGSIKMLGGDEERAKYAGDQVRGFIDNIGFGDKESDSYKNTNIAGDFAQLLIPGGQVKAPAILAKYPKLMNILTKMSKNAEKFPELTKLLKLGGEGTIDTVKYNAINQEYTNPIEGGVGGLLNIVFGKGGEYVGKLGDKIGITGIMNSGKAKEVIDSIIEEGGNIKSIESLQNWFNGRPFKGSKENIIQQLKEWKSSAMKIKNELLSSVTDKYESKAATSILKALEKRLKGVAGREERLAEIKALLKKDNMYTPGELAKVEKYLDDSSLNPYLKNEFGLPKRDEVSKGMAKLRNDVKTQLEKVGKDKDLGNIQALNNEITVSTKMMDGIKKKSISESIKDGLSGITLPAAFLGYIQEGDLGGALKYGGGVMAAKMLANTTTKTWLADKIAKLSGKEKINLTKWLNDGGKTVLSESESKEMTRILSEADGEVKKDIASSIIKGALEMFRVGGVVGGAELTDSIISE